MKIVFLGDIMPGGVLHYQENFFTDRMKNYLKTFDLRVGTLETAIGDNIPFDKEKMKGRMNIIYSKNSDIQKILELNMNIVSLANNHIFDLGVEGLENTKRILSENNIQFLGAGVNLAEASKPIILEREGKKIVFLAYSDYDPNTVAYVPVAKEDTYGINPLIIEIVVSEIKHYKSLYDYVFVMPHWGKEYDRFPTTKMKEYSKKMVEAGADLIIGSHTHIAQPSITYKSKKMFYSLGNFLFPDFYMNTPRPMWYPDKKYDLTTIETTYDYPFPVTKPLKRVWRDFSRVGLIATVEVSKKLKTGQSFSILSKDNIVDLYENKKLAFKLSILGILVSSPLYRGGYYIKKIGAICKKLLKHITR